MKEIKFVNLTNQPQNAYSKGGDIFMPQEGEIMLSKPQPTNPEHSEEIRDQRAADIRTLKRDDTLPVGVRRALEDIKRQEVIENALLGDSERMGTAAKLLKRDLTEKERKALLEAHGHGKGEVGKDNNEAAGVYNYTQSQLLRKVRILNEAGFSKEDRRILMEAGLVGVAPVGDPAIDAEIEVMNNLIIVGVPSHSAYIEALKSIGRLTGVDAVKKQQAIDEIIEKLNTRGAETKEERDNETMEEMSHRFTFTFYPEEVKRLSSKPTEWLDDQFSKLYTLAEEGQELSSPLIQDTQNKVAAAIDIVKKSNPENLSNFISQFTIRLHLLQMRTAIGYKNIDQIKGAAGELRAHGMLEGLTLENGRVGSMFNRFQDLLESTRLSSNKRHHVMLEDAYNLQAKLIEEQMELAKRGIDIFGDLKDIAENAENKGKKPQPGNEATWDDFTWAEKEYKAINDNQTLSAAQKMRIVRIKDVNAGIIRAVRTAYDVFVSSQRMAIVVARGKYLFDGEAYRSDPIGVLNVYNMEALAFEKFDQYSPEQAKLVDRMRLDIADAYLKEQEKKRKKEDKTKRGKPPQKLSEIERLDLGKRLFRDIFAVPDYFSSGWQIKGVTQSIQERFELSSLEALLRGGKPIEKMLAPEEMENYNKKDEAGKIKLIAKKRAEDFGLFMRLVKAKTDKDKEKDKDKTDTAPSREQLWRRISEVRPEEIVRLFRERKNEKLEELYTSMGKIDSELSKIDKDDEKNGVTVYDRFKKKYGPVISLLREKGFRPRDSGQVEIAESRQIELAELTGEQRKIVDKALVNDKGGQTLVDLAKTMQEHIENNDLIKTLSEDNEFADVYARSIIVDDGLLDRLENSDPKNKISPLSKLIGEAGAGGDTLVRVWNNTENAIKAGNALLKFIKEEDLEKKTGAALEFATSAGAYNGLGVKGQGECARYTIGTFLNLAKLDMAWDIIGIEKLPFRIPASEAQRIFGPQAESMGRDELRQKLDHLRGYMSASLTKAREKYQENKEEVMKKGFEGLSKEDQDKTKLNLSDEDKEKLSKSNLPENEFLKNKYLENLEGHLREEEEAAEKFYKDLEGLLEVTAGDTAKRFGLRLLFYLMLAAIGETYMAAKAGSKDLSK